MKKAESKAEKKIRYQRNQNLQKRLNRILAKAGIIYGATRGIRRFILYKLLDAVDEMIEKNQFLLGKEGNLIFVSYLFSYLSFNFYLLRDTQHAARKQQQQ